MTFSRVCANASVDHVADYPEYPSETHPMESLRTLLDEMEITGSFGADQDGYPWVLGYRGPSLTDLTGTAPQKITAFVEDQMAVKSPAEIELIRESSKWGNLAHVLLQRYTRPGLTESEVSRRASTEASVALLDAIGPIYDVFTQEDETNARAYALEAAQAALNALEQLEAEASSAKQLAECSEALRVP